MQNPLSRVLLPLALSAAVCRLDPVSLAQNADAETDMYALIGLGRGEGAGFGAQLSFFAK